MSRIRIEGLLAAFPKLIGTDSQHTFIETENVRYIYHILDQLYVLLITNKQSNIMEDLDTLQLLAKLVPEYCDGHTEGDIMSSSFELVFAFDEVISIGHREKVTLEHIKTFTEMDSHEEKLQKIIMESKMNEAREEARRKAKAIAKQKDELKKQQKIMKPPMIMDTGYGGSGINVQADTFADSNNTFNDQKFKSNIDSKPKKKKSSRPIKGMSLGQKAQPKDDFISKFAKEEQLPEYSHVGRSGRSAAPLNQIDVKPQRPQIKNNVQVSVEEKLQLILDREGGVKKLEVRGELKLTVFDPDDSRLTIKTNGALLNKKKYKSRLHPKINKKEYNQNGILGLADCNKGFPVGTDNTPVILKWRFMSTEESEAPFSLNLWPNNEDGKIVVSVEYQLEKLGLGMRDVCINIPCPSDGRPEVKEIDGQYQFNTRESVLVWEIEEINEDNDSGTLEFVVDECDSEDFYPIQVHFVSNKTYAGIEVESLSYVESGEPVEYDCDIALKPEKYIVE